jgi:hypothetical protein
MTWYICLATRWCFEEVLTLISTQRVRRTSGLQDFRTSGLQDFRTSGLQDFRTSIIINCCSAIYELGVVIKKFNSKSL